MTTSRCVWIIDSDLPLGGFWVPGCYSRALGGDDADCHCDNAIPTLQEQVDTLRDEVALLRHWTPIPDPPPEK